VSNKSYVITAMLIPSAMAIPQYRVEQKSFMLF